MTPARNDIDVTVGLPAGIGFDRSMDVSTLSNFTFVIHGSQSGWHPGDVTYDDGIPGAGNAPYTPYAWGELITIQATPEMRSAEGVSLMAGYAWSYATEVTNSDGVFAAQLSLAAGDGPADVWAADLDGDGDLDLVTADSSAGTVSVIMANGNGTFVSPVAYSVGDGPWAVVAADFDMDEDVDIAAANSGSENISVLINNGGGAFGNAGE